MKNQIKEFRSILDLNRNEQVVQKMENLFKPERFNNLKSPFGIRINMSQLNYSTFKAILTKMNIGVYSKNKAILELIKKIAVCKIHTKKESIYIHDFFEAWVDFLKRSDEQSNDYKFKEQSFLCYLALNISS